MNKRHYEHTLPNIRGSLSNTYVAEVYANHSICFFGHHRSLCSGYVCRSGNNAKSDKGCVGYVVGSYLPILLVSREIGLL